jgi:hypothetical protein
MKFHELLEKSKWEKVQPIIFDICRQCGPKSYVEENIDSIKEYDCFENVYNNLKRMKPVESNRSIVIAKKPSDDDFGDDKERIDVFCREKDDDTEYVFCYPWDESIGMEIALKDGLCLSYEEIVANCLWEMTFWGFSWEEICDSFNIDP